VLVHAEERAARTLVEHACKRAALTQRDSLLVVGSQCSDELRARPGEQLGPPVGIARMDAAFVVPATQLHERVRDERIVDSICNGAVIGEASQLGGSMARRPRTPRRVRGLACLSLAQGRRQRSRTISVRLDGVDEIEHGAERHLSAATCREDGWHIAGRDPAIERGLADPQQPRRQRTADGGPGCALEVRSDGSEIAICWVSVVYASQAHGVPHEVRLIEHDAKLVKKLRNVEKFLN
jgi:hypothetical protein